MPAPKNHFKAALKQGQRQIGCWCALADPYAIEVLASAGFDWLVIDGEHGPNDLRSIVAQLQILEDKASHAVVRLPVGEDWMIKQVLDAGAQTLLIPMVESAAQARALVRAMRYPPNGIRGVGAGLGRASRFSQITDYMETAEAELCLLVQVESKKGVDALDDILAVDGVDGVFVGPYDLSTDLGHPGQLDHPDVEPILEAALKKISASSKASGSLAVSDETRAQYHAWGTQFLAVAVDITMLASAARTQADRWKAY